MYPFHEGLCQPHDDLLKMSGTVAIFGARTMAVPCSFSPEHAK